MQVLAVLSLLAFSHVARCEDFEDSVVQMLATGPKTFEQLMAGFSGTPLDLRIALANLGAYRDESGYYHRWAPVPALTFGCQILSMLQSGPLTTYQIEENLCRANFADGYCREHSMKIPMPSEFAMAQTLNALEATNYISFERSSQVVKRTAVAANPCAAVPSPR
jgi:hypothetical protein